MLVLFVLFSFKSFFSPFIQKKVALALLIEVAFFAAIVLIALLLLHGTTFRSLIVGIVCDVFNVLMYASPLTIMVSTTPDNIYEILYDQVSY